MLEYIVFKGKFKMKKLAKHFKDRDTVIEVFEFGWRNNDIGLKWFKIIFGS